MNREITPDLENKRVKRTISALLTIKSKPEREGEIECPECGGKFLFAKASNGHVRAHCQTDGCLSFME